MEMIITAALTIIVFWCMFYASIPNFYLIVLCLFVGLSFAKINGHKHDGILDIDSIAQRSKLNKLNPTLKFWSVIILMFLCVGSNEPYIGLALTLLMLGLTVYIGGVHLHDYIALLSTPILFLLMSGLALLFDVGIHPDGVINLPIFNFYFFVAKGAQLKAALVMSKAIGAISCLYLLSLSTPMTELICVLRKARVPSVVIELMYLIYRYIFVLFEMYRLMKNASKSRLGFADFYTSVRTTGHIYTHLLARSYRKAMNNFDAMESRCYVGEIQFLEKKKEISLGHFLVASFMIVATFGATIVSL